MLLPNEIKPELSIYYLGYKILTELNKAKGEYDIIDLYNNIRKDEYISLKLYSLSLDWLYIIEAVEVDIKGRVKKCT